MTQMLLTRQDYENYGSDLVDFASRAAIQATKPHLDYLQGENEELRHRLAQESRARLDAAVAAAIPNYQEIDADPRWHNWLRMPDPYTGQIRQAILNDSIAAGSLARVRAFFEGFLAEHGAAHHSGHGGSSGRTRHRSPSSDPAAGGKIWTRPEIKAAYEAHRKGQITGDSWDVLERQIIEAGAQGRIAGGIEPRGR